MADRWVIPRRSRNAAMDIERLRTCRYRTVHTMTNTGVEQDSGSPTLATVEFDLSR
ncbi:MAG: hypothetical protein IIC29_01085 [Chloroflexi bacterium]|nr:hypothetical protein [Chloroflexota bacterium]MCH8234699.1 hypothetical protein [Chloroflexota bacterium]